MRLIAGTVITLGFILLLFNKTDFSGIVSSLKKANYYLIAPALAIYFISFWVKVMRWAYIIRPLKAIPSSRLFRINVIGYTINNVLPARIGELVRAYLAGQKEGVSKSAIIGTIAVERIFDGLALIFIVLISSFLLPMGDLLNGLIGIMALIFGGLFVAAISMAAFPMYTQKITGYLLAFLPGRLRAGGEGMVSRFVEGLKILSSSRRMALTFTYSIVLWSTEAVMGYVIGIAFNFALPLPVYFIATGAANLATTLPTTQAGIGPYEFFSKQTLVLFGVDSSVAAAYAILLHAALILPLVFSGFIFLWMENLSLAKIAESSLKSGTNTN